MLSISAELLGRSSPVSATLSKNVGSLVVERPTHFFLALDGDEILVIF